MRPAATARPLFGLLLLLLISAAAAALPLSRLNPHYRTLLQSDSTLSASYCACPQAAVFASSCATSQATLSFTSQGTTLVTCAPPPVYDQYSRTLTWSACIRSGCLPASFASQGYTATTSGAAIWNTDALAGPVTLNAVLRSTAGVTVSRVVLTTPSGQLLQVTTGQSINVPAEGVASLSLTAQVAATTSSNSSSLLALALSDDALAGRPPALPLPPSPPPSPPPDPAEDNVAPSVIGVIETAYLVGYALQPDAVPPYLDENTTVTVGWSYVTATAGYPDFSQISGCTLGTTEAVAQIVAAAGWTVASVTCSLNAPSGGQAACPASSSLLLSVSVQVNGTDTADAALRLLAFLKAPTTDSQGLGASCISAPPLVSRALAVHQMVDPSAVPPATVQQDACDADQATIQGTLAAALSLSDNQLLLLPAFCAAYQVQPPPVAPYPPPDAPELVRHPYDPWKSALLGSILGGVFVIQIIVLAVWVWYNRQEHRKAEAALALAYQSPQHKYGAVDGHA